MKTTGIKEKFRVVVDPRSLGNLGYASIGLGLLYGHGQEAQKQIEKDWEARCDEIVSDIKRHVENVGSAWVEFDQQHVCSHCGALWTEKSETYNGGCCDEDEKAGAA